MEKELTAFIKETREKLLFPVMTETLQLIETLQSTRGNSRIAIERELSKKHGYMDALKDVIDTFEKQLKK